MRCAKWLLASDERFFEDGEGVLVDLFELLQISLISDACFLHNCLRQSCVPCVLVTLSSVNEDWVAAARFVERLVVVVVGVCWCIVRFDLNVLRLIIRLDVGKRVGSCDIRVVACVGPVMGFFVFLHFLGHRVCAECVPAVGCGGFLDDVSYGNVSSLAGAFGRCV